MNIEERVIAIVADKLGRDVAEVSPEKNFVNDLGADSLDTVELLMVFEQEFKIKIPEDVQEKIATVGDAINFIKEATPEA
ncbi:MAG: acyl carrier protein [Bacteroidales bacterium]|nr:acyl carrier protein [Bacteroidales bacterium]